MRNNNFNLFEFKITDKENNLFFISKRKEEFYFKKLDAFFESYLNKKPIQKICHEALNICKPKIIADIISLLSIDHTLRICKEKQKKLDKIPKNWLVSEFNSEQFYPPNLKLLMDKVISVPDKYGSGSIFEYLRHVFGLVTGHLKLDDLRAKKTSKKFIQYEDILCFIFEPKIKSFFGKKKNFVISNWMFWFNKSIKDS